MPIQPVRALNSAAAMVGRAEGRTLAAKYK